MPKVIEREDYLADLRRVAEELERSPTIEEYEEHGRYSWGTAQYKFGTWNEAKKLAGLETYDQVTENDPLPDEEYLADVRRVAEIVGHPPRRLEYEEHGKHSHYISWKRWGGWDGTLEAAGFDPDEKPDLRGRERGDYVIPEEDLLADLRAGAEFIGRPPTISEVNSFGEYSEATYRTRFGSYTAALEAAGLEVPDHRRRGRLDAEPGGVRE